MTTLAPPAPAGLTGTGLLLRSALRRDRFRITLWALGIGVLTVYTVVALDTVYPTEQDRMGRAALMRSPAAVLFSGPGFGLGDYTRGAMTANELGLTVMSAVAVMSVLLVVRHTRLEEESGRAELVRAGCVGHRAQVSVALAVAGVANGVIALVVTAGLAATGLEVVDSVAFAAGIALVGLGFGAVAAVTAQLSAYTRAASGSALAVVALAVVLRGAGDVARPGGSALSWTSPIGWAQQTRVFVDLRWTPLLLSVLTVMVLVGLAFRLGARRDVGAGLFPPRRGPAHASGLLAGPTALAGRLRRGLLLGWAAGIVVLAATMGTLAQSVADAVGSSPQLQEYLRATGADGLVGAFLSVVVVYVAVGTAAAGISSVLRMRAEEAAGRTEVLLACAVGRTRLLVSTLAVTAAGAVVLLASGGLATGVAAAAATGDGGLVLRTLGTALAQLPGVLVVVAVAAALVGLAPRLTGLAWALLAACALAGVLGALLGLPAWAVDLLPVSNAAAVPGQGVDVVRLVLLSAAALAFAAVAVVGFRRRDVSPH